MKGILDNGKNPGFNCHGTFTVDDENTIIKINDLAIMIMKSLNMCENL